MVALLMAITVVDFLKTVQVYDHEGKLLLGTLCPAQFLFEILLKQPPIVQAGEYIRGSADLKLPELAVFDKDRRTKEIHVFQHIHHCRLQGDGSVLALGKLSMTLEGAVPHSGAVDAGDFDVREELEKMCKELAAQVEVK